jgi:hypothetical protein
MEKFVKLDAIAKMAKPMSAFHGGAEQAVVEEDVEMCECPKCGHAFTMARPEVESEEEYEEYEEE